MKIISFKIDSLVLEIGCITPLVQYEQEYVQPHIVVIVVKFFDVRNGHE